MGNYCKSIEETICYNTSSQPNDERINYEKFYGCQHKIAQFWHNVVVRAKVQGVTAFQLEKLGEDIYNIYSKSSDLSMAEFLRICSKHCPTGLTDDDWEKFVSSICLECFQLSEKDGFLERSLMRIGTLFALSVPRLSSRSTSFVEKIRPPSFLISKPESPSGFSENAVMDVPLEESTPRSSSAESIPTVKIAGCALLRKDSTYLSISDRNGGSSFI